MLCSMEIFEESKLLNFTVIQSVSWVKKRLQTWTCDSKSPLSFIYWWIVLFLTYERSTFIKTTLGATTFWCMPDAKTDLFQAEWSIKRAPSMDGGKMTPAILLRHFIHFDADHKSCRPAPEYFRARYGFVPLYEQEMQPVDLSRNLLTGPGGHLLAWNFMNLGLQAVRRSLRTRRKRLIIMTIYSSVGRQGN